MLSDRQHLEALAREERAGDLARALGITPLQALRFLRDEERLRQRIRREVRGR